MWTYRLSRNNTSKRKVFLGNLQLEHILVHSHNPFQLLFELEKKSSLVIRAFSAKSYTHDTESSFLHSATPRARDGLSVSLVQDLAEKALVTKLNSYIILYCQLTLSANWINCTVGWKSHDWFGSITYMHVHLGQKYAIHISHLDLSNQVSHAAMNIIDLN